MQDMAELQQVYLYAYEYIKRNERNYVFVLEDDNHILKGLNYQNEILLENIRKIKKIKADGKNSSFLRQAGELVDNCKKDYKNPHLHSFYSGVITSSNLKSGLIKLLQKNELDSDYVTDIMENGLEPLSEEEVQKIYAFIKANRIRYNNVPPEVYLQEILDYSAFSFSSSTMLDKNRYLNYFLKHQIESDIKIPVETDDATINKQMAYASNLIDLVYFCFGFIKENCRNKNIPNFLRNLDLSLFNLTMYDGRNIDYKTYTKEKNEQELYGKQELITRNGVDTNSIIFKITNISKKIEELEASRNKDLERGSNSPKTEEKKNKLQKKKQELKQLEERKRYLEEELEGVDSYQIDDKDFFGHIRNSITHNFYEFDFSEALKERRIDLLRITFRDYNNKNDWKVNFEATIYARYLISLCMQFHYSVQDYIEEYEMETPTRRIA